MLGFDIAVASMKDSFHKTDWVRPETSVFGLETGHPRLREVLKRKAKVFPGMGEATCDNPDDGE